jgi:nucleoside-diphosphate-sugar epimerase
MSNHFIFGCGFLGRRLAKRLIAEGVTVWTSTRSELKSQQLRAEGIQTLIADVPQWETWEANRSVPPLTAITVCVGNDRQLGEEHSTVYLAATRAALGLAGRFPQAPCRIQFVSTTGVYARSSESATNSSGHSESRAASGNLIEESAPLGAERPGAQASLACEQLLAQQSAVPSCSFRLAGIYSLDRIPNLTQLKNGQPITGSGDGWLNLIHVEDAATILAQAARLPPPWSVINISDGHPVRRREFYDFLAQRYRCPAPQFTESGGRSSGHKIIDNQRLIAWYSGVWQFPSYREGLAEAT